MCTVTLLIQGLILTGSGIGRISSCRLVGLVLALSQALSSSMYSLTNNNTNYRCNSVRIVVQLPCSGRKPVSVNSMLSLSHNSTIYGFNMVCWWNFDLYGSSLSLAKSNLDHSLFMLLLMLIYLAPTPSITENKHLDIKRNGSLSTILVAACIKWNVTVYTFQSQIYFKF